MDVQGAHQMTFAVNHQKLVDHSFVDDLGGRCSHRFGFDCCRRAGHYFINLDAADVAALLDESTQIAFGEDAEHLLVAVNDVPGVFAAIFIPDRINAIAEYKSARPAPKEKGLLHITRSSPFQVHSWGIMASNQPISSTAICSSRVSGFHAGCADSGSNACSGAQSSSSVSGAGCSGAASHCGTASGAVSGCAGVSGAVCCMAARAASALRQAASAFSARALASSSCSNACSQVASSSALSCLRASTMLLLFVIEIPWNKYVYQLIN